ncbi:hypothetical protein CCACVL1_30438, partial [Corchorus capsularis]
RVNCLNGPKTNPTRSRDRVTGSNGPTAGPGRV